MGVTHAAGVEVELAGEGSVDELLGVVGTGSVEGDDLLQDGQDELDVDQEPFVILLKGVEARLGGSQGGADFGLFGLKVSHGQGFGQVGVQQTLLGGGEPGDLGLRTE